MSSTTEPEVRTCSKCDLDATGDPCHVQYVAFAHPVTGSGVDLSVTKHIQCCAEDGCPICTHDVLRANQDGVSIKAFVTNPRPRDHMQYLFEQFGVESPDFQIPATAEET